MNPTITALLMFGGTIVVFAQSFTLADRFGVTAAVRDRVHKAKERRIKARTLKRAKANFEIWRCGDGRPRWLAFEKLPRRVQEVLGYAAANDLSRIELNL
jgi:hypothetical protein